MSEGLLPKGFQISFNLANFVNNQNLVKEIQGVIDDSNSRLFDLVYEKSQEEEHDILNRIDDLKEEAVRAGGPDEGLDTCNQVKTSNSNVTVIHKEGRKFSAKLHNLRNRFRNWRNNNDSNFKRSKGSRYIRALTYKRKASNGEYQGAPFPKNMRKSKVNRAQHPMQQQANSQEYQVTPEDLVVRDPIILTDQIVELSEDAKALMRKSKKFCPTPMGPIDEKSQYEGFLRWRESMRWKWFFNKGKNPDDIEDDYEPKPWSKRTERKAPVATDCPELEAFFNSIERDIKDPALRRKVKSNITQEQKDFIKEVRNEYPERGLRVRLEDKGSRFVIADAASEDDKLQSDLGNVTQYTEVDDDPIEQFKDEIREWASEAFANDEINQEMFNYVTEIDNTHLARPKPLYKTHKKDEEGNMLVPVPIRTLTVGCGTPVHPLSKLCQKAIEHLTSKEELPRNRKSTKEALRGVININENHAPLPDTAEIAFCDIERMYPSVDTEEAVQSVKRRLQTNPSPLGISPDAIVKGLKICLRCNCVQFKNKFYLPNRGLPMGTCMACDLSDIWLGDVTQLHLDTYALDTLHFSLYQDDGLDFLVKGQQEKRILKDH